MPKKKNYSSDGFKVLKGLQAVRKRYDMYVGGKETACFHLFKEAVDNSVDEFLNGYATHVEVEFSPTENKITIRDDGRGLPLDIHPTENIPTIQLITTKLHAGGKFDKNSYNSSNGKNGVGLKCVNALSKYFSISSYTVDGYFHEETASASMEFSKGTITQEFTKKTNKKKRHGVTVSFIPDDSIFDEFAQIKEEEIKTNLELRAYCNAGLIVVFTNTDTNEKTTFCHPNGIKEYLETLVKKPLCDPYYFNFEEESEYGKNFYEITFQYGNTDEEVIQSFVNGIKTASGTHETGFKMSLTNNMIKYIKENKLMPKGITTINAEDIRKGLYCIINLKHTHPEYKGQTKDDLSNPEVKGLVMSQTTLALKDWTQIAKVKVKEIANRIARFAKGRANANDYIKKVIAKTDSIGLNISKKFVDCATNDPTRKRIYIVEGDSAANNTIYCRDPEYMAVYSLKGKPLNIYNTNKARILANIEMNELCLVLYGTNDFKKFDIANISSHQIILSSDADWDGLHIRALMINDLWAIDPNIIRKGYVYICLTPKYKSTINGKNVFFQDDQELIDYRYKLIKKDVQVTSSNIKLKKIVEIEDDFLLRCNQILTKYSIHEDILDLIIYTDKVEKSIEKLGLSLDKKSNCYKGIYENAWHNFKLPDIKKEVNNLLTEFNVPRKIEYTIDDEDYSTTVFSLLNYIKDNYKLKLSYNKGLGESDPEEFEQFMNPSTERLIQVKCQNEEELEEFLNIFFGNKPELRKRFIMEGLENNDSE